MGWQRHGCSLWKENPASLLSPRRKHLFRPRRGSTLRFLPSHNTVLPLPSAIAISICHFAFRPPNSTLPPLPAVKLFFSSSASSVVYSSGSSTFSVELGAICFEEKLSVCLMGFPSEK